MYIYIYYTIYYYIIFFLKYVYIFRYIAYIAFPHLMCRNMRTMMFKIYKYYRRSDDSMSSYLSVVSKTAFKVVVSTDYCTYFVDHYFKFWSVDLFA